ncbi:MAG: hypothetical protein C0504_00875 [Candidatus Solibacter sp.]|nr:hypothetical protein [Candidatus Solibacter sp.]
MPALLGALRGPVMLMTLGGLLTAHRFSEAGFSKTWPALLIVFGLMKLFQRLASSNAGDALPPGTAGGAQ